MVIGQIWINANPALIVLTMVGFGYFPKDQITVHWGPNNLTIADFVTWTDEVIEFFNHSC